MTAGSEAFGGESIREFSLLRSALIGCVAWVAIALLTGGSAVALILTPVIGPLGGWLLGGALYLIWGFARSGAP
jgi:hypothetical protein